MRIASKSAIGFAISKGLDRYKVFLHFPATYRRRSRLLGSSGQWSVTSGQSFLARERPGARAPSLFLKDLDFNQPVVARGLELTASHRPLATSLICRNRRCHRLLLSRLNQFHIQAQRLQLAD